MWFWRISGLSSSLRFADLFSQVPPQHFNRDGGLDFDSFLYPSFCSRVAAVFRTVVLVCEGILAKPIKTDGLASDSRSGIKRGLWLKSSPSTAMLDSWYNLAVIHKGIFWETQAQHIKIPYTSLLWYLKDFVPKAWWFTEMQLCMKVEAARVDLAFPFRLCSSPTWWNVAFLNMWS